MPYLIIPDSLCLNRIYSQQALSLQQSFIWWNFVRIISFDETCCYLTHSTREFTSKAHFITALNWAAHRSNYKVTFSKSATGSASLILHAVFAFIILHRHGSLNTYAQTWTLSSFTEEKRKKNIPNGEYNVPKRNEKWHRTKMMIAIKLDVIRIDCSRIMNARASHFLVYFFWIEFILSGTVSDWFYSLKLVKKSWLDNNKSRNGNNNEKWQSVCGFDSKWCIPCDDPIKVT